MLLPTNKPVALVQTGTWRKRRRSSTTTLRCCVLFDDPIDEYVTQ